MLITMEIGFRIYGNSLYYFPSYSVKCEAVLKKNNIYLKNQYYLEEDKKVLSVCFNEKC